ncbi:MAG: hypothetical protein Q8R72_09510 [Hylemonella sp.]|nr:hypothetical protein [Hylemonella sp.]
MPAALPRFSCLLVAVCGLAATAALAQQPAPLPRDAEPPTKAGGTEQTIERIRHEDAGSRIDELRVGGETKSITVTPKGKAPAYDVPPQGSNRNPADSERDRSGSGGWNILKY